MKIAIIIIFFLSLLSACYYDKEELLYNSNSSSCDSINNVSYAQHIAPILQAQCSSCHSSSLASGGIVMGTFALDQKIALNGKLYGSITHSAGYSPMPQGTQKLSACQIALIKKWIDSGALNN